MIPIKFQVEESKVKYRPYGVTIRLVKSKKKWVVNIESDDQLVTKEALIMFVSMSDYTKENYYNSAEEALAFWNSIRESLYQNYPEHGYNMGYYKDKEAKERRKEIGWDHIGNMIDKLNKEDKEKQKKKKKK